MREPRRIIVPCQDCENRSIGCHAKCELYKEYKYAWEQKKKEDRERRISDAEYEHYIRTRRKAAKNYQAMKGKNKTKIFRNV